MKLSAVVGVLMIVTLVRGRHIHPGNEYSDVSKHENVIPMDVFLNMKPNRFVPVNNVLFFKISEPCDNGFRRDALGICRDVWD